MVRLLFVLILAFGLRAQDLKQELIFPLEKWHNHSSSIVELPNGDLAVCWFHGSGERQADDVVIQASRKRKGAKEWEKPFVIADTPGFPDTNPVMFVDSKQRLYLFWAAIVANEWHTALEKYRIATDLSKWPPKWEHSDAVLLIPKNIAAKTKAMFGADSRQTARAEDKYFSRMGWFSRTHPLELKSGRILLPLYSDGYSYGIVAISDDRGITWTSSEPIVGRGNIQPSLVQKQDGTIVALMRDNGPPPKRIQTAQSKDDGVTWSDAVDTDVPNPGVSVECIKLKSGKWLLVYNDLESRRNSLMAALSDDEGATWKWKRHLDRSDNQRNAYHYPSVIQAKDGTVHVTYSYFVPEGKTIKHVWFKEDEIR